MKYVYSVAIAVLIHLLAILTDTSSLRSFSSLAFANNSYQMQETSFSMNFEDLSEPYLLQVKSSSLSNLSGSISCNGSIIQLLGNRTAKVNLSPYLRLGQNDITIRGQYSPVNAAIDIELIHPNNEVTQSISGSGLLNQRIFIEVQ